jgi:hypothetical protein
LSDGRRALTASGIFVDGQNGRYNAAGFDHCIRLVDTQSGKVLAKYESPVQVIDIELSKDGRRALIVGNSGVRLIELPR